MADLVVAVGDDLKLPSPVIVPLDSLEDPPGGGAGQGIVWNGSTWAPAGIGGGASSWDDLADKPVVIAAGATVAAARAAIDLAAAPMVLVWSGTGFRRPGASSDLTARPTANPVHLMGGATGDRPVWANQDGDAHDTTA